MAAKKARAVAPAPTQFFVVSHGGYPFDVLVAIGSSDDELHAALDTFTMTLTESDREAIKSGPIESGRLGCTILLDCGATILRLRDWHVTPEWHARLAHEIFHAVTMLFERLTMRLTEDSDEAYAYAVENLTRAILQQLALPPSKRSRAV